MARRRAFLDGRAGTSEDWLDRCERAAARVAAGKKFLVVDGVGFPAVGSVCGTSNAAVAARLRAPVVVVAKSGVGGAVDAVDLAATYFEHAGVPVLGCVLNNAPAEGFYARDAVLGPLSAHFATSRRALYGVAPVSDALAGLRDAAATDAGVDADAGAAHVRRHVDVDRVLADAARDPWNAKRRAAAPADAAPPVDAAGLRAAIQATAAKAGASTAPGK